ncbi:MAG: histidine kinase, partial [Leptolyngbya sp. SIO4C5]|nr:histidine kinase [Leptolyngbya sp. SIO4C5]
MQCIDDLLELEPFKYLPRSRLEWMCDRAESMRLDPGTALVQEGEQTENIYVLVCG